MIGNRLKPRGLAGRIREAREKSSKVFLKTVRRGSYQMSGAKQFTAAVSERSGPADWRGGQNV
jgi:hypothetical protein